MEGAITPPFSEPAEKALIGSLFLRPDLLDELTLQTEHFYLETSQVVFPALLEMHEAKKPIDTVTVAQYLDDKNLIHEIGGFETLADLLDSIGHANNAEYYAGIVKEKHGLRSVLATCGQAMQAVHAGEGESQELISDLEQQLVDLRDAQTTSKTKTLHEAILEAQERRKQKIVSTPTGFLDIDTMLDGGVKPGQFIVVAGRPGSGKTVWAAQVAKYIAEKKQAALYVSLEMDAAELAERYAESDSPKNMLHLPLHIEDGTYQQRDIIAKIRLAKKQHDIQLAVVDYLQLIKPDNTKDSREQQIGAISRSMKQLARELKIPIICPAQLNRKNETEQRRPRISDLRESGTLEQDADIVILLHNDDENDYTEAIIGKQRNGKTGIVNLTFRGEKFRFENYVESVNF